MLNDIWHWNLLLFVHISETKLPCLSNKHTHVNLKRLYKNLVYNYHFKVAPSSNKKQSYSFSSMLPH